MREQNSLVWTAIVLAASFTAVSFVLDDSAAAGMTFLLVPTFSFIAIRLVLSERRRSRKDSR